MTVIQRSAEGFESLNGPVRLRPVHGAKLRNINEVKNMSMTRTELQEIGWDIIKTKNKLLDERREDWYSGRYSAIRAWEDAVKEICLLP